MRLADVPLEDRRAAAKRLMREESDLLMQIDIWRLAEKPGNLVAWIAE